MGSIKSRAIRTLGEELIKESGSKFSADFVKNRQILDSFVQAESKKQKNILAGYITRKMRAKKQPKAVKLE